MIHTIAKTYRAYLSERGELVTLREKIARNPKVEYLIGSPFVHSGTAIHIFLKGLPWKNATTPNTPPPWCVAASSVGD